MTKLFTQFQLEVNNQLSYVFKDIPREKRRAGLGALAAALFKFVLGAWLYAEVYEFLIGRRPALDPIGILNDTVGDLTGWEVPNLVELGVGAVIGDAPSWQVEEAGLYETAGNLGTALAEELPFIGGLLGGGGLGSAPGITIFPEEFGIKVLTLPVGGFLTLGCLIALMQWALAKSAKKKEAK